VRLPDQLLEEVACHELRLTLAADLLVPPDAVLVGRAADDVRDAVAVHVIGVHVGAGRPQGRRVELPRLAVVLLRLLPPAARTDDIEPAVTIDVAHAQAVRVPLRSGNLLAGGARLADGMDLPGLRRILAGGEPAHLPLVVLPLGLRAHDED